MSSELDPEVADKADALARWLAHQAEWMSNSGTAARMMPDGEIAGVMLGRMAEFTQILASSYQFGRRKLAEEKEEGLAWQLLRHREGRVFSMRSFMELLAAQVYQHPNYADEAVQPGDMKYYVIT